MPQWQVIQGRVEEVLASGDRGKFDAVFCDPPYGLRFMGASWDHGVPSAEVWAMVREHIYPGSHVVAFGGTRTWHRLAVAMEDAGLEMRDSILAWMYGQGWPKPADVSKYIDKAVGAKRAAIARAYRANQAGIYDKGLGNTYDITAPGSPEAASWNGWHGNLAPSWEPALLFREPGGTYAGNALEHGVSGLWIDGNRIGATARPQRTRRKDTGLDDTRSTYGTGVNGSKANGTTDTGRWPANAILCCEESICGDGPHQPGCPVYELDAQSGVTKSRDTPRHNTAAGQSASKSRGHDDAGGASRFFYQAKVSRSERGDSAHPCMKPLALCRHIAGLLLQPPTRPRRLLVPYSGSGSEMIGALQAGWDEVVGIEFEEQWVELSRRRIERELLAWREARGEVSADDAHESTRPVQMGLFAER